jgi:predicted MFS family arabinose efflux permease
MLKLNNKELLLLTEELPTPGRFALPSLCLSYFAAWSPVLVVGLLLPDIGDTFGQSVGMIAQIQTLASLVTAITAILMGVWFVRYNFRSLLLLGLLLSSLATFGCSIAFNFPMMLISYSIIWGIGLAMVEPMLFTITGEQFPLEQRAKAIGWLIISYP